MARTKPRSKMATRTRISVGPVANAGASPARLDIALIRSSTSGVTSSAAGSPIGIDDAARPRE
jgi:hypothetical protein